METPSENNTIEKADVKEESTAIETKSKSTNIGGPFKKPILIGKIGHFPKKITAQKNFPPSPESSKKNNAELVKTEAETITENFPSSSSENELPRASESSTTLPYQEPIWSGLPKSLGKDYSFEILKNGLIIERVNLMERSFWVFGRLVSCSIYMQHPTISRYHAVLQYRSEESEKEEPGFYIYDLGSTHGTFLNKNRLKPRVYTRVQVGHMIKLGCSTRCFILNGPEYDEEEESDLSVSELKQKRAEEIAKFEEAAREAERLEEERKKKEEERGIDWGLSEDADEETDLSENPYAQSNNEDLYLEDPKKALRGFFEREGLELEYDCNEQGMGQFLCKVELPVDDEAGRPVVAEVLHKGKKKEAVVQCALEACRILDRFGVLRQAQHESRKRKAKNWEENDFYDSDDDTFLDRTGTIEKKREKRMNAKVPQKAETYETLLEKEKTIASSIADLEKKLTDIQNKEDENAGQNTEEDPLDTFMKELSDSRPDKQAVSKIKLEVTKLKAEHAKVIRLVNIAKPASLPSLAPQYSPGPSTSKDTKPGCLPVIGKRKKVKMQFPTKPTNDIPTSSINLGEENDEEDDDENEEIKDEGKPEKIEGIAGDSNQNENPTRLSRENDVAEDRMETSEAEAGASSSSPVNSSDEEFQVVGGFTSFKSFHNTLTFKKFEKILKKGLPPFAGKHQDKLQKILNTLKKLAANEDRMHVDWKMLSAKKRKVMKLISDLKSCEPNEKLEHKVSSELNRILKELNIMTEQKYKVIDKVKKMGNEIKSISEAIDKDFEEYKKEIGSAEKECETQEEAGDCEGTNEKKKKKNQRRSQQRQERAEQERQRGYEEDATRADYNMWVPPRDQTGDGRTPLNDRLGY